MGWDREPGVRAFPTPRRGITDSGAIVGRFGGSQLAQREAIARFDRRNRPPDLNYNEAFRLVITGGNSKKAIQCNRDYLNR